MNSSIFIRLTADYHAAVMAYQAIPRMPTATRIG